MEDQEDGGQAVRSSPYQSPMYNFAGSILMLTNPEQELYKLELTLRNMTGDGKGGTRSLGKPLMNDKGVSSVLGQAQALVNQITVMSNLDRWEIQNLMLFLGDSLAKDLMLNRSYYDIENAAARDKILFSVSSTSFICMKRATDEGERKFWKGSQQDIHMHSDTGGGKRAGLMQKAMGWGSK